MSLSGKCGLWTQHRHQSHGGVVRRLGDQYQPRGPASLTPFFSTLCIRCINVVMVLTQADTFVIQDGLNSNVEVKVTGDNDADTLAEVSIESDSY